MLTSIVPTRHGSLRAAIVGLVAATMIAVPHASAATPVATPQGCTAFPISVASPAATPGPGNEPTAAPTEAPGQAEQNPAGDIPDSQAFVTYTSSAGGYAIAMPEGWARQEQGPNVTFSDKLHTFSVEIFCADSAPTDATARAETGAGGTLQATTPGFELVGITDLQLPAGQAVHIAYRADSAPDDVTGMSHRVDVERFELFHNGMVAVITLSTPAGSDNVDVARQVSESFTWQA